MLIGYPMNALKEGDFHIECNKPGCGTKVIQVVVGAGPVRRKVQFIGATFPRFEDPPLTKAHGADPSALARSYPGMLTRS